MCIRDRLQALGLDQVAVVDEALGALAQFFLDGLDGAQHRVARRHIVRAGVDGEAWQLLANAAGQRIEQLEAFDFVIEQRQAQRQLGTVSCIYGIGNPGDYHAMVLILRAGDQISRREILARLVAMQYTRNDAEFTRGVFRVRGETIDIFPAESAELALRLLCRRTLARYLDSDDVFEVTRAGLDFFHERYGVT